MKTMLNVLLVMELYGLTSCLYKQHFFVNQMMTWYNANVYCKDKFDNLATFTNATEQQQFLEDTVGQTSDAWVGLYIGSSTWRWLAEDKPAADISWPIDQSSACGLLHNDSKTLNHAICNNKLPFFCMTISEFVLVPLNQTWEEALQYCRYFYTDLARLSSQSSLNYALRDITAAQTEYMWTGLRFVAGVWFWVTEDDLDSTAWSQVGMPQCPARNLHCGALYKNTIWMPIDCEEKLNFFCSMKSDGVMSPVKLSGSTATSVSGGWSWSWSWPWKWTWRAS